MQETGRKKLLVRRKEDLISYRTEEEVYKALIEVIVFAVCLVTTTTLAVNCRNIYEYYTSDSFRRLFLPTDLLDDFTWEIKTITNIEDWWQYVRGPYLGEFTEALYFPKETSTKETDPLGLKNKPILWGVNILLHAPSLFQIRVKPKKCAKYKFLEGHKVCYGIYNRNDQADDPYYKGTSYIDTEDTDMLATWATIETYSGGGYFQHLPPEYSDTILEALQNNKWVDAGTRLVVLSLETFNYNLGIFVSVKLITEVLPTGNVVCAFLTQTVTIDSIWSTNDPAMLITACIFYFIVTYNMGNEIYEIISFGFRQYISVVWNYIDWGVIITAYISLGASICHPFLIDQYLRDIEDQNKLASLDKVFLCDTIFIGSISLCTFQLWIRIFRFISFNQTMLHFNMALRRCAPEIIGFLLILVIFFNVFAIVGLLAFGIENPDFQNFKNSFFFMFRLMLHDFDYDNFHDVDPIWGPIYVMCYVSIVVFILVNMFLAIISQTYIDIKQIAEERQIAIKSVFLSFFDKVTDFIKVIREKLPIKKSSVDSSLRRIQFKEDGEGSISKLSDDGESPRKTLSENEALKDYFGIDRSPSVTSRDTEKSVEFKDEKEEGEDEGEEGLEGEEGDDEDDDDEDIEDLDDSENIDETGQNTTLEFISRLQERLDLMDVRFHELSNDLDSILSKFESKARKTLVMPKPD